MLRQHANGCYPLQRPYCTPQRGGGVTMTTGDVEEVCPMQHPSLTHHQFIVQVGGVRELEVGTNTVWGEADCFIQYHFPTQSEDSSTGQYSPSPLPLLYLLVNVLRSDSTAISHQHHPVHAQPCLRPRDCALHEPAWSHACWTGSGHCMWKGDEWPHSI